MGRNFLLFTLLLCFSLIFASPPEIKPNEIKSAVNKSKSVNEKSALGPNIAADQNNEKKAPLNKDQIIKDDPYGGLLDDYFSVDVAFIHAFIASLSVIIVSELGDKTFFIAAIMAMRHPRKVIFIAAIAALALMTIMSAFLGYAITVIPRWFTYYFSSALFALFGIKMLKEGYEMSPDEGKEEYDEVQAELRKKDEELSRGDDAEYGGKKSSRGSILNRFFSQVFLTAFTLTFLAEWGDRSQIATIILGARENVYGVIIGGVLGHSLCTGLAVIGGRFIAQRISVKTVTILGGVVFLIFALSAFFIHPDD